MNLIAVRFAWAQERERHVDLRIEIEWGNLEKC